MDVFPVDWVATEKENSFEILCFGKLQDKQPVVVHIPFFPFFFVQCRSNWSKSRADVYLAECMSTLGCLPKYSLTVSRKTMWGFTNGKPHLFVQLAFSTLAACRKARRIISEQHKMSTFESSVDQILRLFHVRSIRPAEWLHINSFTETPEEDQLSAHYEVNTTFSELSPSSVESIPPIVFASWDIECYSESGKFPLAENANDVICTICTTFQRFGEPEPYLRHATTLGWCDPVPGVVIESRETEAEVINAWIDRVGAENTDVLVGWNTYGFDYKYVYGRSLVCVDDESGKALVQLTDLGKLYKGGGLAVQKNLSSAAYGENSWFYISAPGILHLDLMQLLKKDMKLDSYSLQNVSQKFLGTGKLDLKPAEIFRAFKGTDADRAMIVEYCCKDTELPLRLMLDRLSTFQNLMEMGNAVSVPLDYLITRGQQIKVFSLILQKARALGYVCPDVVAGASDDKKYEGATVLDAMKGAYLDDIISALDFASLYPSIIRAHNLCPSTLVRDSQYADLPGITYFDVETPTGTCKFAQGVPSVLPSLLDDLALYRKKAKKAMAEAKAAGDTFKESVQNGRQLAFKVSMNSAYGFFGANKGYLPCIEVASSVTTVGRDMIQRTKEMVETLQPGSRVIYGDTDSVLCIFQCGEEHRTNLVVHFEMAQCIADIITKCFKPPNELEFEKCYYPFLLFSKKRYAGMVYTSATETPKMDVKGLQLVRRDNCPLVKVVSADILDAIMREKSVEKAVDAAKTHILRLLENRAPTEMFVVSKSLRSEYANPESQPHVQVAKKIHQRRGTPPANGERVPYVFIEDNENPDGLQAQRAEDPQYVDENSLVIDRLHYLDSQLSGPIETLLNVLAPKTFETLMLDPEITQHTDVLRSKKAGEITVAKRLRKNKENHQNEITKFLFRI